MMTVYTLDEIIEITNGGSWTEAEYSDSEKDIYVVKVTNMVNGSIAETSNDSYLPESLFNKYKNHQLKFGDVCIATVGSHPSQQGSVVGRTIKVQDIYSGSFLNQNAAILRPKDGNILSNNFFYYLTKTIFFKHHVESRARGSANQVRMAIGELKKFSFNYPDIQTQKKVAAVLSAYDDLIENNKKRIQILENMAEELYKEWFVRFRFPNWENTEFEKGVPKDWSVHSLDELANYINGYAFKPEDWGSEGLPIIKIKELNNGICDDTPYFSNELSEKYLINNGDILFSWSGSLIVQRWTGGAGWVNQHLFKVVPNQKMNLELFFYHLKNSIPDLEVLTTGATMKHIKRKELKQVTVLVPSTHIQIKFSNFIISLWQEIDLLSKQLKVLINLKSDLLPRLISGKISVENLDIQFPPSMQEQ